MSWHLPNITKKFIESRYCSGIRKPSTIKQMIMDKKLPQMTDIQLYNLLSRLKRKHLGASQCALGEFVQWCEARSEVPDDSDAVFVVDYDHEVDMKSMTIDTFRVFLSTKRLLSFMDFNDTICADATHKVNWQGTQR